MDSNVLRPAEIPDNGDGYLHHSSHGRSDSNGFNRILIDSNELQLIKFY